MDKLTNHLLKWYQKEKRSLPWRDQKNVYYTWISEIMLQQTRVEAVKVYYKRFIEKIPTIKELSQVNEDELLKLWEGLGYYTRARNLKKAAIEIEEKYGGKMPENYEEVLGLPGIGPYTAGAILSIGYQKKYPAIDGNVIRIFTRLFEWEEPINDRKLHEKIDCAIEKMMPEQNPGDFNQALMDLGAMVCLPKTEPKCEICPLSFTCRAYLHQTQTDYPKKTIKKKRRIEQKTIFIFAYKDCIAIQKRTKKGLLHNLYEFKNEEGKYTYEDVLEYVKYLNIPYETILKMGDAKHIFSHLEWHMTGYYILLKEKTNDFTWISKEELKNVYSIPTAFSYFKDFCLNEIA